MVGNPIVGFIADEGWGGLTERQSRLRSLANVSKVLLPSEKEFRRNKGRNREEVLFQGKRTQSRGSVASTILYN